MLSQNDVKNQTAWPSYLLQQASWLLLAIYLVGVLKTAWSATAEVKEDTLFWKLGAATVSVGLVFHRELTIIILLWMFGTLYCAVFIQYTQWSPKHQSWISTFASLTPSRKDSPHVKLIRKSFLLQTKVVLAFSVTGIALFSLLYLISCPRCLFIYCLFNYLVHVCCAFTTAVYMGSTGSMFVYHCIIVGLNFNQHAREAKELACSENNVSSNEISAFLNQILVTFKQFTRPRTFWKHINSVIFLSTYLVQFVLLYLLFFIPIPFLLRCAILIMVVVNFLGGQSIHFAAGQIAKTQVERNLFQLDRLMFTGISFISKIKILNLLEHTEERKFNTIFSSIEYSLSSFILVTIENAILFMLMIVNYDRV